MKNILQYRGYIGSIEFSDEDNCLFGKVIGIRSLISYEGTSVAELKQDSQDSVDDYLELCSENNIEPEKPYERTVRERRLPLDLSIDPFYSAFNQAILNRSIAEYEAGKTGVVQKSMAELEAIADCTGKSKIEKL